MKIISCSRSWISLYFLVLLIWSLFTPKKRVIKINLSVVFMTKNLLVRSFAKTKPTKSYSQTQSADRLRHDTHINGTLRETHTHIVHAHSQTEERSKIRCTQTVQCRQCRLHLYWRLGLKWRHQVIKKKSERKNKREGEWEGRRERDQ